MEEEQKNMCPLRLSPRDRCQQLATALRGSLTLTSLVHRSLRQQACRQKHKKAQKIWTSQKREWKGSIVVDDRARRAPPQREQNSHGAWNGRFVTLSVTQGWTKYSTRSTRKNKRDTALPRQAERLDTCRATLVRDAILPLPAPASKRLAN